jgi:NifU-like protein involved in Fe-S cluster formation
MEVSPEPKEERLGWGARKPVLMRTAVITFRVLRQIQSVTMYSKQVLDHFEHPRFAGELENATVCVDVENPACGDRLRLALRIEGEQIVGARFKAKGCVSAMACASRLAEMVTGLDLAAAGNLTREELVESLGGLPEASTHAGHLAIDALREALGKHTVR